MWSAVSRQPSAVSRQPSAVSRQPSAVSRQPSARSSMLAQFVLRNQLQHCKCKPQ